VTGRPLRDEQRAAPGGSPFREDHRASACRYCGQPVVDGKRGWRLVVNGPAGYEPKAAPYDCEQAPLGYHAAGESSLF
jgi:hypothetical protein